MSKELTEIDDRDKPFQFSPEESRIIDCFKRVGDGSLMGVFKGAVRVDLPPKKWTL